MQKLRIYTLSDSREPDNIRYIGKTIQTLNRRLTGHICTANRALVYKTHYGHCQKWILKVLREGGDILIEELDSIDIYPGYDWDWLEQYWISQFKQWGFNLTNISNGGPTEWHPTKEAIEARASKIRGVPRDEATRKKISESNAGKPKSEVHKRHVKESMTEKFGTPVVQLDKNTRELIARYPSISIAAETIGKNKANIGKCCQHKYGFKTAYGYIWEYESEYIV